MAVTTFCPATRPGRVSHAESAADVWRDVVVALSRAAGVAGVYAAYAAARNLHGQASAGAAALAERHAGTVVAVESWLGLPPEHTLQSLALRLPPLVKLAGAYYGTAHFAVTLGVLVLLLLRRPAQLVRDGTALAVTTFAAVAVFTVYPVAPPRLMPVGVGAVDTLATIGGVWSYDHGVLERISDPYAAMPSLHLAWATWCAVALWRLAPTLRRPRLWRTLAPAYPVLTLLAVLVTGNHWYLDTVAGTALSLLVMLVLARFPRSAVPGAVGRPVHLDAPPVAGLPAGAVPVPPVVLPALRPHHQVRQRRREELVAPGAAVGPAAGRPGQWPDHDAVLHPLAAGRREDRALRPAERLERGGRPSAPPRTAGHRDASRTGYREE